MQKFLQMLVIGVTIGAVYGFIAAGVVLVYRTTKVLNVAHPGVGILCGFIAYDVIVIRQLPYFVGVAAALLVAVGLGLGFEKLVLRPLHGQPTLQTGSTLVLAILLAGVCNLRPAWTKLQIYDFPSPWRDKTFRVPLADQALTYDQLLLVLALGVFVAGSWWALKRTRLGLGLRAMADDPAVAPLLGIRADVLTRVAWAASFALSGLTTVLVVPMLTLDRTVIVMVTIKALTAAFVGEMVSVPLMAVGALVLGVLESASDLYWYDVAWLKPAWPFLFMLAYLVVQAVRGRKVILEDRPAST